MDSQLSTILVAALMDDRLQNAAQARRARELKPQPDGSPRTWRRWFPRPGFARSVGA
jgi:hypothetical protein